MFIKIYYGYAGVKLEIIKKDTIKTSRGWKSTFLIIFNEEEMIKIAQHDKIALSIQFKDYEISMGDKEVSVVRYFMIVEPWEDETLDEIVDSIKEEIKFSFQKLIQ